MQESRWKLIQEIFLAVADLPPAQRENYLHQHCGADQELRAEIEALVAADAAKTARLEFVVDAVAGSAVDGLLPGTRLGAYEVEREIGRGGMGTVFLAHRSDDEYQKQVAIKVVRRGMDTDDLLARFRAERQILADLDHPYYARLLDGGSVPDGRPFLVMEYVEGEPIAAYCEQRRLGIRERCALFVKVCEAVAYAHQHHVVHRDIKPGNILVKSDGTPKLLDFGLAKLLQSHRSSGSTTLTRLSGPVFTPDYASPEQVGGLAVTPATDIYSLGAVLYQLLTSKRPHELTTYSSEEVKRVVCEQTPKPPSHNVDPEFGSAWRKQVAGDLDAIVLMALRKEPERRYPSVAALQQDLQNYLAGDAVVARPDSLAYRWSKFSRRRPVLVATLMLALVAVAVIAPILRREARQAEARRLFESAREMRVSFQDEAVQRAVESLRESIRLDPGYAPAHAALAEAYQWQARNPGPFDRGMMQLALDQATEAVRLDPDNADSLQLLGSYHFFNEHDWVRGEREIRRSAVLRPAHVPAQVQYVLALTVLGRFDQGLRLLDQAEKIKPGRIEYMIQRALLLLYQGRYAESIAVAQKAADRDPNGRDGRWALGMALGEAGQLERAIQVLEGGLNKEHRDTRLEAALGNLYGRAGRKREAMEMIARVSRPPANVTSYVCRVCSALIYSGMGDADNAVLWLQRASQPPEPAYAFVPIDPRYARIVKDPRYLALMAELRRGQDLVP